MKSKLIKIGIVGLGRWAKVLTQAAQRSTKFSIVAGYSRSEEKRQSFQKEFGIPSVPDMETMLADPESLLWSEETRPQTSCSTRAAAAALPFLSLPFPFLLFPAVPFPSLPFPSLSFPSLPLLLLLLLLLPLLRLLPLLLLALPG